MLARFVFKYECDSKTRTMVEPVADLSQASVLLFLATRIDLLCPCEVSELEVESWVESPDGFVSFRVWDRSIGHPIKDFIVGSVEPADER